MIQKLLFLCLTSAICHVSLWGQKENSNWYFGNNAAVNFKDGLVTPLSGSAMSAFEGCATISDTAGKLMFYTNGLDVWNSEHTPMVNGNDLKGNASSTQSAMIVRRPSFLNKYYIITVNGFSGNPNLGAYFSEVDMTLDGGKGAITGTKNVSLLPNTDEKITAVRHMNGNDIWVIIPERFTRKIHAYLVTDTGISRVPVSSDVGVNIDGYVGYLHATTAGDKIGMALYYQNISVIADFDNSTGAITQPFQIPTPGVYGLEFSPSGRFLYVSDDLGQHSLIQYDLMAGSLSDIILSKYSLLDQTNSTFTTGALQIAIDNKIYFSQRGMNSLGVIQYPDNAKAACGIRKEHVVLKNNATCAYGLQNTLYTLPVRPLITFTMDSLDCKKRYKFSLSYFTDIIDIQWNFGDTSSGIDNSSDSFLPHHFYLKKGLYYVTATITYNDLRTETLARWIKMDFYSPFQSYNKLPRQVVKCVDDTAKVNVVKPGFNYLWNTGSTNGNTFFTDPGIYKLLVTSPGGCKLRDSIEVINHQVFPKLRKDTIICESDSIDLWNLSTYNFSNYKWNNGLFGKNIRVTPGSHYILTVEDAYKCLSSDTVWIGKKIIPDFNLGKDTNLCVGQSISFNIQIPGAVFLWQDGHTTGQYTINSEGTYHLKVELDACTKEGEIQVKYFDYPIFNLGADDSICFSGHVKFEPVVNAQTYLWNTGSKEVSTLISGAGVYILKASNAHCWTKDTIEFFSRNINLYIPNAFSPDNNSINDVLKFNPEISIHNMKIYNAWGELVFSSDDPRAAWDATRKGEVCQQGVYLLILSYRDCKNRLLHTSQTIQLLR